MAVYTKINKKEISYINKKFKIEKLLILKVSSKELKIQIIY